MTKKNIMPVAVLTVICVVVAILLAVVNYFTAPIIKDNADKKVNESLYAVLPDANGFENVNLNQYENVPASVVSAHKDKGGSGHVVVVETSTNYTSGAKMSITVGVGSDGKIKGVTLNAYTETKDFGKDTYPKTFVGLGADDIDVSDGNLLVAGVTYSSKAFKSAINDALNFVKVLGGEVVTEVLPRTDEEIINLAKALVGEGAEFVDVTPEDRTFAKRIYKEKNGKGYVAYVLVVSSRYGTPETETLVHVGKDGKIVKAEKLLWKPSDAAPEYNYNPPSEAVVDAFYAKFIGKNTAEFKAAFTAEGAELASGATSTSKALVNAIIEALEKIDELIFNDMPRDEATVKALAAALIGEGANLVDVTPEKREFVKRIYKDQNGKGYVAYVVVISTRYGTPETETLVHVGADGKIANVSKLLWKPSDPAPEYGYNPPSEAVVDAFYAKFIGKNTAEFKAVFTAEGAELASGATTTSKAVVNAIIEGLEKIDEIIYKDMPRDEATVKALAAALMGEGTELEEIKLSSNEYVKRLYRDKNGKGYVAYVAVISSRYGTAETETLVHFGNDGKIAGVKKVLWKPSDPAPEYGYNPPSEAVVDAFYAKFVGKTSAEFEAAFTAEGAELASGATTTSKAVVNAIIEAYKCAEAEIAANTPEPVADYTPRMVGIIIISVAFAAVAALVVIKIVRRRKI